MCNFRNPVFEGIFFKYGKVWYDLPLSLEQHNEYVNLVYYWDIASRSYQNSEYYC